MKRLPVGELMRLACIYAEQDRRSFAEAHEKGAPEEIEASALADQLHAYRVKRWGRTQFEADIAQATTISAYELCRRRR